MVWHFSRFASEIPPFESNTQQDCGTYGLGFSLLPENDVMQNKNNFEIMINNFIIMTADNVAYIQTINKDIIHGLQKIQKFLILQYCIY